MAEMVLTNGLVAIGFARRATLGLLEEIPADKACHQIFPGANHALWIVGHLAAGENSFLTSLAGVTTDFPAEWNDLFATGSTPHPDPGKYPTLTEVRAQLDRRREELIRWFKDMSDEQLAAPLPAEYEAFARNHAALLPSIAWHEGLHAGQLTVIRKALGLPPRFA
ncbi:MAG: DinB family protein [Planctomycetes bacterium]|nr:DinB family protein [Planctomycetota bacterium]